jgi:hypothetical protein
VASFFLLSLVLDRRFERVSLALSKRFGKREAMAAVWSYGALGLYLPYRHVADGYLGLV